MATPSIAMIPSAYKSSKVYSVLPTNGDGDLTFTRASSATRVNKNGLIEEVASNLPRLDYSDGGCPSLLLEPQSTNLATYSEDFSDSSWIGGTNAGVIANALISPDGTQNADIIIASADTNSRKSKTITVTPNVEKKVSVWVKSTSGTLDNQFRINFGATLSTLPITSTWNRVSMTVPNTDASSSLTLNIYPTTVGGFVINSEIALWGIQVEEQSNATSYIPTTGATATRLADVASLTTTGFGLTAITETFKDGSANVITTIPTTYNVSEGKIAKIIGE